MSGIEKIFWQLSAKDNKVAYEALQILQAISEITDSLYPYMRQLTNMLDSDNSYIRTRGIILIAYNARWDKENILNELIDKYLRHITDRKPITARQCIKLLPMISKYKPELNENIIVALNEADISTYSSSMQSLIYSDIQNALIELENQSLNGK